jgi:hypothetical protein
MEADSLEGDAGVGDREKAARGGRILRLTSGEASVEALEAEDE